MEVEEKIYAQFVLQRDNTVDEGEENETSN